MGKKNKKEEECAFGAVGVYCKLSNESIITAFLLPLFFWGLLEASPPAQYAPAFPIKAFFRL